MSKSFKNVIIKISRYLVPKSEKIEKKKFLDFSHNTFSENIVTGMINHKN